MGCSVTVSLDGTTAPVNDAIRGRDSFDGALRALAMLNTVAAETRAQGAPGFQFGILATVLRSNYHQIEDFCTVIAPMFPEMTGLRLGAGVPMGLASREGFAASELLTPVQLARLGDPEFKRHLRGLVPTTVAELHLEDDIFLQLHSEQARRAPARRPCDYMEIEPDGGVRAIGMVEGTVGNIRFDSPEEIWQRCQARVNDPLFVEQLAGVRNHEEWAAAARSLDRRFASDADLIRLRRRPEYVPGREPH
jgi:MoaA/NifB/PqqE/SkfB family radical SAM enzyme